MGLRNRQSYANGVPNSICILKAPFTPVQTLTAGCDAYGVVTTTTTGATTFSLEGNIVPSMSLPDLNPAIDGDTIEVWDLGGHADVSPITIQTNPGNTFQTFLGGTTSVQINEPFGGFRFIYSLAVNAWQAIALAPGNGAVLAHASGLNPAGTLTVPATTLPATFILASATITPTSTGILRVWGNVVLTNSTGAPVQVGLAISHGSAPASADYTVNGLVTVPATGDADAAVLCEYGTPAYMAASAPLVKFPVGVPVQINLAAFGGAATVSGRTATIIVQELPSVGT
jgi:hypothetical protein